MTSRKNNKKNRKRLRYLDIDRTAYRMGGPRIVKTFKINW
jgi:hypothetical protein